MEIERKKVELGTKLIDVEEVTEWMVEDLRNSIQSAKANYLVALGLVCYIEILGRYALKGIKKIDGGNRESFEHFLVEYMGYGDLLRADAKLYDRLRNGLCHEYTIKGTSGVFVNFGDEKNQKELQDSGHDISKGILISPDGRKSVIVVEKLLEDFEKGVDLLLSKL